jgi:hypothetical protein
VAHSEAGGPTSDAEEKDLSAATSQLKGIFSDGRSNLRKILSGRPKRGRLTAQSEIEIGARYAFWRFEQMQQDSGDLP